MSKEIKSLVVAYQKGEISLKNLITGIVGVVILGTCIPVLWPLFADTDTDIQAMTGTDAGTTIMQSFWPILLIIAGIGIVTGIIFMVWKRFKG